MTPDWLVAAGLTFAGSVHCMGMCGGFAVGVAAGRGRHRLVADQVLLQLGKASSYAFLGALCGLFGGAAVGGGAVAWGGRLLALVTGLAICAAGLTLLGLRARSADPLARWAAPLLARIVPPLLAARPRGFPIVVGMVMGFLPCPLVYAGLAAAAASASPLSGAAILSGVALGTVPALVLAAACGSVVKRRARELAWAGGLVLVAVGLLTLARAVEPFGHRHGADGTSWSVHRR